MTQVSSVLQATEGLTTPPTLRPRWRVVFGVAVLLAIAASLAVGAAAGSERTAHQADAELTRLLEFMAAVKAMMTIGLCAAVGWRLGQPVSAALAALYIVSGAMMCAATALIFQMEHIAAGAVLFHVGLFSLLGAATLDDGTTGLAGRLRRSS